jgi:hypothetical protein
MKMVLIICPGTRIDDMLEALEEFSTRCAPNEHVRAVVLPVERSI